MANYFKISPCNAQLTAIIQRYTTNSKLVMILDNMNSRTGKNFAHMNDDLSNTDRSNQTVYDVSSGKVGVNITSPMTPDQKIDQETVRLINWLAEEQNIPPEYALKRAVGTAAYIHDLTENKGGKLLVLLQDGAIHEILLKNKS